MKVLTLLGTRPDIIRLSRIIPKLDKYFNHILVHTGQNYDYELNSVFFEQLEVRSPNYFLDIGAVQVAEFIGGVIEKFDNVLEIEKPDAILVLGDTNSTLGIIAAKRRKIPIFHMEAGNRSFDLRVPEEINRKIVDHISDINLPYTQIAKTYLVNEGFPIDQIIVTGSPLTEVLCYYKNKINETSILNDFSLEREKYFIASFHREENVDSDDNLTCIIDSLHELVSEFKIPVVVSTHPRTQKRLKKLGLPIDPLIQFVKPFGFIDYIKLQTNSLCVISDSGTITEESSILNFPAVNLRNSHERPEGMEEMVAILSGINKENIIFAVKIAIDLNKTGRTKTVRDYDVKNVSDKIVGIIASYTGFVNRKIWKK